MSQQYSGARIKHKHNTENYWKSSDLIPLEGELIIYDPDEKYDYYRIKIGDGVSRLEQLPFVGGTNYIGEITDENEDLKDYIEPGVYVYTFKDIINYTRILVVNSVINEGYGLIKQIIIDLKNKTLKYRSGETDSFIIQPFGLDDWLDNVTPDININWEDFQIYGYISDENFTDILKEKLENLYSKKEIDIQLSGKQNISNTFTDIRHSTINLDGKTQYYYLKTSDTIITVWTDTHMDTDEFTFYLYLDISCDDGNLPSVQFVFYSNEDMYEFYPHWLEIPTIDYPHTQTLFAFQTLDGGATWIANQCYSKGV